MVLVTTVSLMTNHSLAENIAKNYSLLEPHQRQSLIERLPPALTYSEGQLEHWNFQKHQFSLHSKAEKSIPEGALVYQKISDSSYMIIHVSYILFCFFFIQGFKGFRKKQLSMTSLGRGLLITFGGMLLLFLAQPLLNIIGIDAKLWILIWLMMSLFIYSIDLYVRNDIASQHAIIRWATTVTLMISLLALPFLHQSFLSQMSGIHEVAHWLISILLTVTIFSVMMVLIKVGMHNSLGVKQRILSYLGLSLVVGLLLLTQFRWHQALALTLVYMMVLLLMDMTQEEKRINFLWLTTWVTIIAIVNGIIWWTLHPELEIKLSDVFNYFSLSFALGLLLLLLMIGVQSIFPLVWGLRSLRIPSTLQLRHKVELATLGVLILAFVAIGGTTYLIEKKQQNRLIKEQLSAVQYGAPSDYFLQDIFEIQLFDKDQLFFSERQLTTALDLPPYAAWNSNAKVNEPVVMNNQAYWKEKNGGLSLFRPVEQSFLTAFGDSLLSKLFNIYVFLFLICLGLIYILAQSITRPLTLLGDQLESISLGKMNPRIEWRQKDELGDLIQRYNAMLDQLDHSAEALATTERDQAWKEMAKQVAHEIKNPLTPMKLSIQYLDMKTRGESGPLADQVKKTAATLIEQIDNMTRIAENFSQFGSLPQITNQKVLLNEVVTSVHDLFRKREDMDIQCRVPIDDCFVFADKDHLIRILNNIIKNAIQAIPRDRRGNINISLERKEHHALITVEDNGEGIPEDRINKIFQPNFTTKRSGTGLGLAMCSKMIDSMEGKIYFETEVNVGTTFFIEIPLLRIEENYSEEEVSI